MNMQKHFMFVFQKKILCCYFDLVIIQLSVCLYGMDLRKIEGRDGRRTQIEIEIELCLKIIKNIIQQLP